MSTEASLGKRIVAEAVGTAFLLVAVVGSGIMAERLSGGNTAIALLANTIATGAALAALILTFGPVSGAHFNPAVTLADASQHGLPWREAPAYLAAQVTGALAGVACAHLMFGLPLFSSSRHPRGGPAQMFSEFHRHLRAPGRHLGMLTAPPRRYPLRRGSVHNSRVLVYGFHLVCQPRRDPGPLAYRHL